MIVAVALGLALLIQAFLVKPFRIPSRSMVPTLAVDQRVLVDRVSFRFSDPHRGDIVVFNPPRGADNDAPVTCAVENPDNQPCPKPTPDKSDQNFIKRVIGEPGDKITVRGGRAIVNGKPLKEPYARFSNDCGTCNLYKSITVPEDHYFMMGDNRGESADSREWGPVPKKWMIGNAFGTYWPPKKIGTL